MKRSLMLLMVRFVPRWPDVGSEWQECRILCFSHASKMSLTNYFLKVEPAVRPCQGTVSVVAVSKWRLTVGVSHWFVNKCGKQSHVTRVCRSHGDGGNKGTRDDGRSDEQSGK